MKREIEMYIDVFKEKSGKISCNVLYQGKCYLIRNKSLDAYVDEIFKLRAHTMCTRDDVIKIYVDIRGIGYAMYDMLRNKCDDIYKLEYEKYDQNTIRFNDNSIDMGLGWTIKNIPTVDCKNIKISSDPSHAIYVHNDFVSEKDVEQIVDKKFNEKTNNTEQFINEITRLANVKFGNKK